MSKREPLKAGDRVAVYSRGRFVAKVDRVDVYCTSDGVKHPSVLLRPVDPEQSGALGWYHPKQCRRLVKKPRREWIIRGTPAFGLTVVEGPGLHFGEIVTVREVRKSKK
jgi:hypothetical protein